MDWEDRITIDQRIVAGHPVIKGTRVPVKIIVGALAAGSSVAEVCEGWGIAEEDVRASLGYAAEAVTNKSFVARSRR